MEKISDILFEKKAELCDLVVKHMIAVVKDIYQKLPDMDHIELSDWFDEGVCERVGTWIMNNDGETGEYGIFVSVKLAGDSFGADKDKLYLTAEGDEAERYDNAYDYGVDDLVYLYDQLEKIRDYLDGGE